MELVHKNHVRRGGRGARGNGGEEKSEVHTCDRVKLHLQRTLVASFLPFLGECLWRGCSYKKYKSKTHSSQQTQTKGGVTRTELFKSEEKHACDADEGECAEEDLEVVAGLAGGCAWAVRAKGYVVCCLWGRNTSFSLRSFQAEGTTQDKEDDGATPGTLKTTVEHNHIPANRQSKQKLTSFFLIKRQFLPILLLQNLKLLMNSHLFLTRQLSPLRLDVRQRDGHDPRSRRRRRRLCLCVSDRGRCQTPALVLLEKEGAVAARC